MKTLGAIVRGRKITELQILAELWGAPRLVDDSTEEILNLERHMREPIAVRTLWSALCHQERAVLSALVGPSARNWCPTDDLPERTHLDPDDIKAALAHLQELFIIDREMTKMQGQDLVKARTPFYNYMATRPQHTPIVEREIVYVPTEIATTMFTVAREYQQIPQDRTTLSMDDLLMPYRQGDLDQIGRRFSLVLQSYCSRNEARMVIAQNVVQPNAVAYALKQLPNELRDLYEQVLNQNGKMTTTEVCQHMSWSVDQYNVALRTFEEFAIAFDGFSEQVRHLFIPKATLENLQQIKSHEVVIPKPHERPAPRAVRPADTIILWDMAALVATVLHSDIELTRTQVLPKRVAQRIANILNNEAVKGRDELDTYYLAQLQYEAIDLGILAIKDIDTNHFRLITGERLLSWSTQDYRMQTRRILRRWPTNRNWQDRQGARYAGWMSTHIVAHIAREAMLNALRDCKPGVWYDIKTFLKSLRGDNPFVIRPNQRFNGNGGFKVTEEILCHWDDTDSEYLLGMLNSTLYELGIVSLGYDADTVPADRYKTNPDAFMLTELGAEVLQDDIGRAYVATEKALIAQPNLELLLMEPHMPAVYQLIRFAQIEQLGRASRFRLNCDYLLRAIGSGMKLAEIIVFLQAHSKMDIAPSILTTLQDWARKYKEIRVVPAILIEVEDEMTAQELIASSKLRELGLQRVNSNMFLVPEGKGLRAVKRAIEKAGYLTQGQGKPATDALVPGLG